VAVTGCVRVQRTQLAPRSPTPGRPALNRADGVFGRGRVVKRRGKGKALVAVARSILVIIWHLLADPTARYHDLGPDYHDQRVNTNRKVNSLVRQLEALGHTVTLKPTA
jgi:hypothetical protein